MDESELILMGRVENIDDLTTEFGCKAGSLPSFYLGLPLGALFKSTTTWMEYKKGFARSCPCGRDNTFPKEGELL